MALMRHTVGRKARSCSTGVVVLTCLLVAVVLACLLVTVVLTAVGATAVALGGTLCVATVCPTCTQPRHTRNTA